MALATYPTYIELFPGEVLPTASPRVTALILELPGCFSVAPDETQAVNGLRVAVPDYFRWLTMQDVDTPTMSGEVNLEVKERFTVHNHGLHLVRGFFAPDGEPLTDDDLDWGLALMSYAHIELISQVQSLTSEQWQWQVDSALPTMEQLIDRLAQNEVWLSSRLDVMPHVPIITERPGPALARYDTIHEEAMLRISQSSPQERDAMTEHNGERWSMRKMIRRSIQEERETTEQIALRLAQLLAMQPEARP